MKVGDKVTFTVAGTPGQMPGVIAELDFEPHEVAVIEGADGRTYFREVGTFTVAVPRKAKVYRIIS